MGGFLFLILPSPPFFAKRKKINNWYLIGISFVPIWYQISTKKVKIYFWGNRRSASVLGFFVMPRIDWDEGLFSGIGVEDQGEIGNNGVLCVIGWVNPFKIIVVLA